ncbi:unnamed protein product [Protopolystoma xenopodis]|uniref:Uncharacterized protein n=1 Tax=Protopolystoma xenopodis TaxID=117903 RepID=A0A448WQP4_9PLAT|nr:unnamed protein product [Protopolystoma xenopodis]
MTGLGEGKIVFSLVRWPTGPLVCLWAHLPVNGFSSPLVPLSHSPSLSDRWLFSALITSPPGPPRPETFTYLKEWKSRQIEMSFVAQRRNSSTTLLSKLEHRLPFVFRYGAISVFHPILACLSNHATLSHCRNHLVGILFAVLLILSHFGAAFHVSYGREMGPGVLGFIQRSHAERRHGNNRRECKTRYVFQGLPVLKVNQIEAPSWSSHLGLPSCPLADQLRASDEDAKPSECRATKTSQYVCIRSALLKPINAMKHSSSSREWIKLRGHNSSAAGEAGLLPELSDGTNFRRLQSRLSAASGTESAS